MEEPDEEEEGFFEKKNGKEKGKKTNNCCIAKPIIFLTHRDGNELDQVEFCFK